jgi:hypothetical protein
MSVSLKILPEETPNSSVSFNVIDFNVGHENIGLLNKLKGILISKNGIECYCSQNTNGDVFFGSTICDGFQKQIRYVTVKQFLNALKYYKPDNYTNRAVIAYLKELPKELRLFLYWH